MLKTIQINNIRNILDQKFDLHQHINIINGGNGSGKTAFLEAVYLLSYARSFRTRELTSLLTHNQQILTIFANMINNNTISIQKSLGKTTNAYINKTQCIKISELLKFLPIQIFYQDIFNIIDASPAVRRSLLDWGLFYMVDTYHVLWKEYSRALQQRNTLLKQRAEVKQFLPWNKILSDLAMQIDVIKQNYIIQLNEIFQKILIQISEIECSLQYYNGWDRQNNQQSLETILADSLHIDLKYLYTKYGAHQAELLFTSNNYKIKNYLSRGQQKIILYALKFAQAILLNRPCIFLMDDLFAELDKFNQIKLIQMINNMSGQFFLTCSEMTQSMDEFSVSKVINLIL